MSRNPLFHLGVVALAIWLAFYVHSCIAGTPVKDRMRVGDVDAAPLVQVGLGRCLRDSVVRIAVRGPTRCGAGASARQGELAPVGRGDGGRGDFHRSTVFKESPVTIVPEEDGTIEVEYSRDRAATR
jgi:hypothetical protein